jgi:ankyrin repeat protein
MLRTTGHQPAPAGEEVAVRTRSLPNDPSLEHLRKEAKRLRSAVRAGDAAAIAQAREFHPRSTEATTQFSLTDAQLAIARRHGFASWSKLKAHLTAIKPFAWHTAPRRHGTASLDEVFVRLACLVYGAWHRSNIAKAERLLRENPGLASATISTAAAAADVDAVRAAIERDPALVNAKGGPLNWQPLLYACYSRLDDALPKRSSLEVARVLLECGADPNAGFMWNGTYAFTALTGAFGRGEDNMNELPHPRCDTLARLLLDAGADPNDTQTLYNRHFEPNDDHLRLLFSYGLGRDRGGPWIRLAPPSFSLSNMLAEQLGWAAQHGFAARVELLVEHAVDVNARSPRDGRTPYEQAVLNGHPAIAEYLAQHGAARMELGHDDRFALACIAGRRDEVQAMLAEDPGLLDHMGYEGRVALLHRAVEARQLDGVKLLVDLGADVNGMIANTAVDRGALHNAAGGGDLDMVKWLIALGADPALRDYAFNSTAIGWARYGHHENVVAYLAQFATIFDAVRCDAVARVAELLRQDPSLANAVDEHGGPLVFHLHPEMSRLEDIIGLLIAHGTDLDAPNREGKTLLSLATDRAWMDFADVLRAYGAGALRG